jgi:multidrug efflux system membrane fusion protein
MPYTPTPSDAPTKLDTPKVRPSPTLPEIEAPPEPPPMSRSMRWLWLLVLAAAGGAAWYFSPKWLPLVASFGHKPVAAPVQRPVPVGTSTVSRDDVNIYLNGLGTVTAFYTVTIRSRIDGELVKVAFTEGQLVKQGDLIAEIDPRPYQSQLKQAEGTLMKDQAALKGAQLDLDRYLALVGGRSISPQQVDSQRALVQQAEGAIQADQGIIDNVKLQLDYCHITAPISGRIGLRQVDPGNMVRANDINGLAVVTQLQPIAVMFTIPQDQITKVQAKVNAGQELTVEAFDRQFVTRLASGKLLAIDNQVDATTGTLRLKAVFPNADNMLFPNQFVNARLLLDTMKSATVVPSAAVQLGPESRFVYVVKPDSTVELRTVEVGATEDDKTVVASGLNVGETVVTDGIDKLQNGSKVVLRGAKKGTDSVSSPPSAEKTKSPE